jgi:ligand-binding sensor domain-containing protein/signal transduction histidine kinase/DNA-binding response OmpR family regulator
MFLTVKSIGRKGIFLLFCFLTGLPSKGQKEALRFQHYTADDGLSQNMIDCILKDSKGYMWFGTWNGLNRFDGYSFAVYRQNQRNKDGIINNFIYALAEDCFGNIWVGTGAGLTVYIYKKDRFRTPDNKIIAKSHFLTRRTNSVIIDHNGWLWTGTDRGVDVFKIEDEYGNLNKISLSDNRNQGIMEGYNITSIFEDTNYNIWIGTTDGVFRYNRKTHDIRRYGFIPSRPASLSNNNVNCIFQDHKGNVWIGTTVGLNRMTDSAGLFVRYYHINSNPNSLVHNTVMSITEDVKGNLIIGTLGGLSIYQEKSDDFRNQLYQLNTSYGLNNEFVNCLLADEAGNVWVGTERGGVNKYNIFQKGFEFLEHEPGNPGSLSHKIVNSIWEDDKNLWIGTAGGGLNCYEKKTAAIKVFRYSPDNPSSLSNDFITSIIEDKKGNLWVGSWGGGLHRLTPVNKSKGSFDHFTANPGNPQSLISDFISSIIQDDEGNLWIGTLGGLDIFNPRTSTFAHFTRNYGGKNLDQVGCLQFDKQKNLWAGTIQGLFMIQAGKNGKIDPLTSPIHYYTNSADDPQSISGNYVISICVDHNGSLWFGTYGNGLNHLVWDTINFGGARFINYTEEDGLSNNIIYSIIEDNQGILWLSTDNGLSRFDPEAMRFTNYYEADGLQSNQFYWSAGFKNQNGKLYFGSMNGLNAFYPDQIAEAEFEPATAITDFKIFNHPVEVGKEYNGRIVLENSLPYTNHIILSYKSREFSFSFSALDYVLPEKITYRYYMDGFDEQWTHIDASRRFASYTNLKGGDYVFYVQAVRNEKPSSTPPSQIKITIIPPFYETLWFKLLVFAVAVISIMSYNRYRVYSLRLQKRRLELLVKERTAKIEEQKEELRLQAENLRESNLQLENRQKLIEQQNKQLESQNAEIIQQRDKLAELNKKVQQINQQQLNFFTYISHEFRSPLTLITAPLENLMAELHDGNPIRSKLQLVFRNTQRLLHLVDQLMEIRKVETGKTELHASRGNISAFARSIAQSFHSLAQQRCIKFNILSVPENIEVFFDRDKVENILYNLLSNAFKYTDEEGEIGLEISLVKDKYLPEGIAIIDKHHYKGLNVRSYVEIVVSDTGPGIDPGYVKDIFRRFYRIASPSNYSVQGSGIGLYLVKEMVKSHKGLMYVNTAPGKGSRFIVMLPSHSSYLAPEEIDKEESFAENSHQNTHIPVLSEVAEYHDSDNEPDVAGSGIPANNKPVILLIDDDRELQAVIENYLRHSFRVIKADNGKEGLQKARELLPDLIISDIIMPELDGIELCNEMKANLSTSHIPLILLTARTEAEDVIEGLESGADDYIPKPFNIRILEAKCKSLIENRQRLRKIFATTIVPVAGEVATTPVDEQFLQKAIRIVEKNIANPHFSVQNLAKELCVSRSLLHKKLTALVDLPPNDFITSLRLKRSVLLLLEQNKSISEIAFEVGFNDPKYFSRCFRKFYGVSPSEYLNGKSLIH